MFLGSEEHFDHIGKFVLKLVYPHEHNNHRPWALQSGGITVFLVVLMFSQVIVNLTTHSGGVLGFATNISVSEVVNLTNAERTSNGLSTLKINNDLNKGAQLKAKDMFEDDYWAHFAPDGTSPWYFFGLVNYKYTWAGENLARDFATSGGVVAAWMASKAGHRENLLNPNFTEIGVAVVDGNLQGEDTTLVVQLFGRPAVIAAVPAETQGSQSGSAKSTKVEAELNLPKAPEGKAQPSTAQEGAVITEPVELSFSQSGLIIASLFQNTTTSQKVTMSLLAMVALLFVFDSVIIFKKRHMRVGSHSLAHASMILILIVVVLVYGKGSIL
ncbi:MAG: hypothetical protein A2Z11_01560 [Candidatus Woykebacteria bacterium RBG_16_43_9]|uniref:SCP domain-containing protein n=1 Tax=Candidatus Woykebacteria bacterium RBG_16_43_9 TaxID=1802596 RepID=A0A1G1WGJ9_9BACT|nr:MAG: hypothetical protein A2Z11_01560 [Candidatus Woykebacteria bacterium RBG_16_43_9]